MNIFIDDAPSAPTDPNFASVTALIHFDDANGTTSPVDVKGNTWTASGDAQVTTTSPLYGTGSGIFDGTGDSFSTADHAKWTMTGEFTIEATVSVDSASDGQMVVCSHYGEDDFNSAFFFAVNPSLGRVRLVVSTDGTTLAIIDFDGNTFVAGTRYRIACSRDSSDNMRCFFEGAASGVTNHSGMFNTANTLKIGALRDTGGTQLRFKGKIDEFRITSGVCRQNANYTPSASLFPDA